MKGGMAKDRKQKTDSVFLPTSPYPCVILDVGTFFQDRTLMKKLDRHNAEDLPWHTPILTSFAYRRWSSSSTSEELIQSYCRPTEDQLTKVQREEAGTRKPLDLDNLHRALARSVNLEVDEYMQFARHIPEVLKEFVNNIVNVNTVASHYVQMDLTFLMAELYRYSMVEEIKTLASKQSFCTMLNGMKYCETKLPGGRPRWPKLKELKWYLLGERTSKEPYDILGDLEDTEDCYHELIFRGQDVTE